MYRFLLPLQPEDKMTFIRNNSPGKLFWIKSVKSRKFSWHHDNLLNQAKIYTEEKNYNRIISSSLKVYESIVSQALNAIHENDNVQYHTNNVNGLTRRENDVAGLAALRLTNKEIADSLFISENTVKSCLKSVFGKLDITKRTELAHYFNKIEL